MTELTVIGEWMMINSFLRSPASPCKKGYVIPKYDQRITSHCDLSAGRQAGRSEAISNTLHSISLPWREEIRT